MTDEHPAVPDENRIDRSADEADADPAVSGAGEQPVAYGSVSAADHAAGAQTGTPLASGPAPMFSDPGAPAPVAPEPVAPQPVAPQLVEPPAAPPVAPTTYEAPAVASTQAMPAMDGFPTQAQPVAPAAAPVVVEEAELASVAPDAPVAVAAPVAQQPYAQQPGVAPYGQPYVAAPVPPKRKHNRLFGAAIALLSSAIFAALYAVVAAGLIGFRLPQERFMSGFLDFLYGQVFLVPVIVYVVVAILVAVLLNRARWFGHIIGSIIVGALVFAISVAVILFLNRVLSVGADEQRALLVAALTQPVLIAAGFVAREVSMWFGFISAARGRRVVARNAQAREDFDREQAERADSGGYATA